MLKIIIDGVKKIRSKSQLFFLSLGSLLASLFLFYLFSLPQISLLISVEKEISGYTNFDITCKSRTPQALIIDEYLLDLDYEKCKKIQKIKGDIVIKVYESNFYSMVSELYINNLKVISKDHTYPYYLFSVLRGLLWLAISLLFLTLSVIYAIYFFKRLK
ncbi:hypothetical protein NB574_02780 [Vibrio vulnificus]|uniref:Uncharacterized protein n=1 Tax=Vibrio vulnificus TaxID=672 RepID=A0AAN1UDI7_VIBVL|nr:hypothetical protein [Vibrio vulnificus]AIL72233.1 hypothetical protein VV93_v1c31650 [Vibrio vulnificus]ARN67597.1 hypothetical protein FORC36_3080 [Vibrio vulnificus]AXX61466.1 hypothetical protein FORC53_3127 [Vibrio vulnificus]EGQ9880748.1 hypothetical protein [Vibrio vulnificus]EIO3974724.1 hypothetical protein [Vibrio vulnificus]